MQNTWDSTYVQRQGTANQSGTQYEYKMAALLYIRALNLGVKFQLGMNVASAGAFDDIVLRYESGSEDVLFAIQLKHKDPEGKNCRISLQPLSAAEGDFSLNKYFKSYCDNMQDLIKPTDRVYLVLYTNATIDQKYLRNSEAISDELIFNLNTGGETGFISHFNIVDDLDVCAHFRDDPKASEFLNHFTLFSGQASENELNEIIKQEIIKFLTRLAPERNALYRNLLKEVKQLWEMNSSVQEPAMYLTKYWPISQIIIRKFKQQNTLMTRVKFEHSVVKALACELFDSDCKVLHVIYNDATDVELRSLKFLQALKIRSDPKFLLVSSVESEECLYLVLDLWERGWCDMLVFYVDETTSEQHVRQFSDRMMNILNVSTTKKLVLISGKNQCNLAYFLNTNVDVLRDITDVCEFNQLDKDSVESTLNFRILFQGKELKLRNIDQNNILGRVLNGKVLYNFLKQEEGCTLVKPLAFSNKIYIPRKLQRHIVIQKELFSARGIEDIFLVTGATTEELQKFIPQGESVRIYNGSGWDGGRFHVTVSPPSESSMSLHNLFNEIKEKLSTKFHKDIQINTTRPVHWLNKEAEDFVWKESLGERHNICRFVRAKDTEIEDVRRLVAESESCTVGVEQVLRSNMRTVLVTGEPGMGKSELLTHVAREAKTLRPDSWVLRVNLSDITADLHDIDTDSATPELVCGLLKTAAGVSNSTFPELAAALLQDAMERTGNLIVLLDAIDEVAPKYTTKVLNILKTLLNMKVFSLWITSRYVMKQKLENELETHNFVLKPFSHEEQKEFLVKLWVKRSHNLPETLISQASKFLYHVGRIFPTDNGGSIRGTPLLIRMLGEIYSVEDCNDISMILNLVDIYEKFVDKKFEICFKEKMKMDTKIAGIDFVIKPVRNRLIKRYKMCSMSALGLTTHLNCMEKLKSEEKIPPFLKEVERGNERVGIIESISHGKPHFVHHTFAEYFAALWLVEKKDDNLSIIRLIFSEPRFSFVRYFFNRILCRESPLHSAVLDNNAAKVEAALSSQIADTVDGLGRAALHLAAQSWRENTISIVQLLLDYSANTEVKDTILQRTPIYHAAVIEAWDTVKLLLRRGAKVENNIADEKVVQNVLELAIEYRFCENTPILHKAFDVNWKIFDSANEINRDTILHLAIRCKNRECVKMLLVKGANTDLFNNTLITPLHESVITNNASIVRLLLSYTSRVHIHTDWCLNPLYYACLERQKQIVRILLDYGVDPNVRPFYGVTPLHAACDRYRKAECRVKELYDGEVSGIVCHAILPLNLKFIRRSVVPVNLEIVNMLIENGADVNVTHVLGHSPLHLAVIGKSEMLVRMLLNHKAAINTSKSGTTPLSEACINGNHKIVKILLDSGADMEHKVFNGLTALQVATHCGHRTIMKLLLKSGANVGTKDCIGYTSLHTAVLTHYADTLHMCRLLVDHGADVMATDDGGNNPLHIACNVGDMKLVQYLATIKPSQILSMKNKLGLTPIEIAYKRKDDEHIVTYLELVLKEFSKSTG